MNRSPIRKLCYSNKSAFLSIPWEVRKLRENFVGVKFHVTYDLEEPLCIFFDEIEENDPLPDSKYISICRNGSTAPILPVPKAVFTETNTFYDFKFEYEFQRFPKRRFIFQYIPDAIVLRRWEKLHRINEPDINKLRSRHAAQKREKIEKRLEEERLRKEEEEKTKFQNLREAEEKRKTYLEKKKELHEKLKAEHQRKTELGIFFWDKMGLEGESWEDEEKAFKWIGTVRGELKATIVYMNKKQYMVSFPDTDKYEVCRSLLAAKNKAERRFRKMEIKLNDK